MKYQKKFATFLRQIYIFIINIEATNLLFSTLFGISLSYFGKTLFTPFIFGGLSFEGRSSSLKIIIILFLAICISALFLFGRRIYLLLDSRIRWFDKFIFFSCLPIVIFCLILGILYLGKIQFGGYDGNILINDSWMLSLGYQPYSELVTGWPPLELIGSKLAFSIWGVSWGSLVNLSALFSAITFFIHIILFYQLRIPAIYSYLLAITMHLSSLREYSLLCFSCKIN